MRYNSAANGGLIFGGIHDRNTYNSACSSDERRSAGTLAGLLCAHRQGQAPYTPGGDRPLKEGKGWRPEGPPEAHREELKAGGLGGQEVPGDGPSLRGPYPGGQHRAYEGGREVRP